MTLIGSTGWFIVEFSGSYREYEASAEHVELGTTNHRALQQLEAADLPLGLTAAPGEAKGGAHGGPVLSEAGGEAFESARTAGAGLIQPCIERRAVRALRTAPAWDDPAEPLAEFDDLGRLAVPQDTRGRRGGLGIEVAALAQEMPRKLL